VLVRLELVGLVAIACGPPPSAEPSPALLPDAGSPVVEAGPPDAGELDSGMLTDAGDAGDAATDAAGPDAPLEQPMLLSETGLFANIASEELGPGVTPYEPRFELWSDGATKRRWLQLPPGTAIDKTDMDYWSFPVGTRVWKEFSKDAVRIETRLLMKVAEGQRGWFMMAYAWNAEQTEAVAVEDGQSDALGTTHDIPAQADCRTCHNNIPDLLLGVSAVQLDSALTLPGSPAAQEALGYLHVNCGTCHNPRSTVFDRANIDLRLLVTALGDASKTPAYLSTVNQPAADPVDATSVRVVPGDPDMSQLYVRMDQRGSEYAMPPLATEHVDEVGLERVRLWIEELAEP
jgi:hypothetical protein